MNEDSISSPFALKEGPTSIEGRHEVAFEHEGRRVYRYLTDKQTAEFVSLIQSGKTDFTESEVARLTTAPHYKALEDKRQQETG